MKRVLICALAVLMVLSLFAACEKTDVEPSAKDEPSAETEAEFDPASLKTFGDLLALKDAEFKGSGFSGETFVYLFMMKDTIWRAIAKLPKETLDAYNDIDIFDPDYKEKENEILAPFAIDKLENLSDQILSEDARKALVGKTGEELLNAGWETGSGYNLVDMEFYMVYGPFEYTVRFEAQEKLENSDDFDEIAAISPLKVESVTLSDVSQNALHIEQ